MGYCKPCQRDYVKASKAVIRERIRGIIQTAKDRPCMDCGEKHPSFAMDFDHRDPKEKSFDLSNSVSRCISDDVVLAEIAKCDVVCALCHRYRTYGEARKCNARMAEWQTH